MTEPSDFTAKTVETIMTWNGVAPPNPESVTMVTDLQKLIADFTALRGTMRFEDEPATFELALLAAAAVEVTP